MKQQWTSWNNYWTRSNFGWFIGLIKSLRDAWSWLKRWKQRGFLAICLHNVPSINITLLSSAKNQFFSKGIAGQRTFVLKPTTGKTHQLRVTLKSIGAAILGDTAYGGTPSDRRYLHAYGLDFVYRQTAVQIICLIILKTSFKPYCGRFLLDIYRPLLSISRTFSLTVLVIHNNCSCVVLAPSSMN